MRRLIVISALLGTPAAIMHAQLPQTAAGTPANLDAAYEKTADVLIRQQLELGGARLAKVLNRVLR